MGSLIMRPSWSLTLFPALGAHFLKLAGHIQLQYVNLALSSYGSLSHVQLLSFESLLLYNKRL